MFCEVERSYIEDGFNLYGLRHWVPSINDSLDVILDRVCECMLLHGKSVLALHGVHGFTSITIKAVGVLLYSRLARTAFRRVNRMGGSRTRLLGRA